VYADRRQRNWSSEVIANVPVNCDIVYRWGSTSPAVASPLSRVSTGPRTGSTAPAGQPVARERQSRAPRECQYARRGCPTWEWFCTSPPADGWTSKRGNQPNHLEGLGRSCPAGLPSRVVSISRPCLDAIDQHVLAMNVGVLAAVWISVTGTVGCSSCLIVAVGGQAEPGAESVRLIQ